MKDEIVSFETAKLAKEKEFNEPCSFNYSRLIDSNSEPELESSEEFDRTDFDDEDLDAARENGYECYLAPTQSLLQR